MPFGDLAFRSGLQPARYWRDGSTSEIGQPQIGEGHRPMAEAEQDKRRDALKDKAATEESG